MFLYSPAFFTQSDWWGGGEAMGWIISGWTFLYSTDFFTESDLVRLVEGVEVMGRII